MFPVALPLTSVPSIGFSRDVNCWTSRQFSQSAIISVTALPYESTVIHVHRDGAEQIPRVNPTFRGTDFEFCPERMEAFSGPYWSPDSVMFETHRDYTRSYWPTECVPNLALCSFVNVPLVSFVLVDVLVRRFPRIADFLGEIIANRPKYVRY
jgi:hypothetical protein